MEARNNVPQSGASAKPGAATMRRMLAPNVICLHPDDRPAVAQSRRRGLLPANARPITQPAPLQPGDVVLALRYGPTDNRVRLVERVESSAGWIAQLLEGELRGALVPVMDRAIRRLPRNKG